MNKFFDNNSSARYLILGGFILAAAFTRLLPHPWPLPWNFNPITALALFGAALIPNRFAAIGVPLLAMIISDFGLELLHGYGFHTLMPVVYGCFIVISLLGSFLRRFEKKTLPALGFATAGSVFFFIVTNASVWAFGNMYPHSLSGLVLCYEAALPFFGNSLAGDLLYTGVLFGGFALAEVRFPVLATKKI